MSKKEIRINQNEGKKKGHGCLSAIFVLLIISFIGSCFGGGTSEKNTTESAQSSTEDSTIVEETIRTEESTVALTDVEIFTAFLTSNPDVSIDAANATYDTLTNVLGFEKVTATKNLSGTLFEVQADDFNLKVTVSDKLYMVICGGYNLYQNDAVQYTKQDLEARAIGNNGSTYYVIAQEIIRNNLKNPSNAKFCSLSECQMSRNNEYVAVKGYVDATNSFNAVIRNDFVVEFKVIDLSSFSYETIYINLNGDTAGTYIELD